jgi:hypothetical protein
MTTVDKMPVADERHDEEQRLREQFRVTWERLRMAEAYRVRPRGGVEGRPASLGLVTLFSGCFIATGWVVVSQGIAALGPDGPGSDNLFAEPVAGAAVIGTWLMWLVITLSVLSKYRRLRRARAQHEQELARALAALSGP